MALLLIDLSVVFSSLLGEELRIRHCATLYSCQMLSKAGSLLIFNFRLRSIALATEKSVSHFSEHPLLVRLQIPQISFTIGNQLSKFCHGVLSGDDV